MVGNASAIHLLAAQRTAQSAALPGSGAHGGTEMRRKANDAADRLRGFVPDTATTSHWQRASRGTRLPAALLQTWGARMGVPLPSVRLHDDPLAHRIAESHDAEAVTVGRSIYLSEQPQTPGLLAHELAHVAQGELPGPRASVARREAEARNVQSAFREASPTQVALPGPSAEPMRHPAARVLLRTGRWLVNRTTRSISKHIARHGRRIAGRAVHSVFRNPRAIRDLVRRTVNEATALARRATRHGADEVIEGGGVRIFRQATRTPGKFRYVVEKDFGRAIGTRGETILRVVLDASGRIVTAFPVDRLLAIGGGAAALSIFDTRTADAADRVRTRIQAEEDRPIDWIGEIIDFLNPLSGGSLNEGEQLMLDIDRIVRDTAGEVIREIEAAENVILDQEQRRAIHDLVEVAIGAPMELEELED